MISKIRQIIVICAISGLSLNAIAHSPLIATSPKDGSTVDIVPAEVSLTFKKNIHLTKVVSILDGERSTDLKLETQTKFGTHFLVVMKNTDAGVYSIEWRGLGEDGHFLNGSFSFTVK